MYRDQPSWYFGVSSFWFANTFKWFLLLIFMPILVAGHVPGGEKNTIWGAVVMLGAIESIFGPALWGSFSDRVARRIPFLLFGVGLTLISMSIIFGAQGLTQLAIGYLMVQVADDIATGPYAALIPDRVPREHRGRASGILGAFQAGSQVVAAGMVAFGAPVSAAFLTIGILQTLTAVWATLTVREKVGDIPQSSGDHSASVLGVLRANRNFRWVWLTRFLISLGFTTLTTYGLFFIQDRIPVWEAFGLKFKTVQSAAGIVLISIALFGIFGALLAARYADRMDRRTLIRASGLLMFASMLTIGWINNLSLLACLASVFGFGYGVYSSVDWALASDTLERDAWKARDMGIWQASIAMPQILVGSLGIAIDSVNRSASGQGYTVVFLFASALFLVGSQLVKNIRPLT